VFVFKDAFRAEDYCGFSLFDPVFPLIYVNNSMPKSRQIFTLFQNCRFGNSEPAPTAGPRTQNQGLARHPRRGGHRFETDVMRSVTTAAL